MLYVAGALQQQVSNNKPPENLISVPQTMTPIIQPAPYMDCVCTRAACQDSREAQRRTGSGGHLAKHSKRNVGGLWLESSSHTSCQRPSVSPSAWFETAALRFVEGAGPEGTSWWHRLSTNTLRSSRKFDTKVRRYTRPAPSDFQFCILVLDSIFSSLFHSFSHRKKNWHFCYVPYYGKATAKVTVFLLRVLFYYPESKIWQRFKAVAQVFMEELRT